MLSQPAIFANSKSDSFFVRSSDGRLFFFSPDGPIGMIGGISRDRETRLPVVFDAQRDHYAIDASCGPKHALVLVEDGTVFSFGFNESRQCGFPRTRFVGIPQSIALPAGISISGVCCSVVSSYCLTSDGGILAFGENDKGQLGVGDSARRVEPTRVVFPSDVFVIALSVCSMTCVALTKDGRVFTWGSDGLGTLGREGDRMFPAEVFFSGGNRIRKLSCGYEHVIAVSKEGAVYGWGYNGNGQLASNWDQVVCFRQPQRISIFEGKKHDSIEATGWSSIFYTDAGRESEGIYSVGAPLRSEIFTTPLHFGSSTPAALQNFEWNNILTEYATTHCTVDQVLFAMVDGEIYGAPVESMYNQGESSNFPRRLLKNASLVRFQTSRQLSLCSFIKSEQEVEEEMRSTDSSLVVTDRAGMDHILYLNRRFVDLRLGGFIEKMKCCGEFTEKMISVFLKFLYSDQTDEVWDMEISEIISLLDMLSTYKTADRLRRTCMAALSRKQGIDNSLVKFGGYSLPLGDSVERALERLFEERDTTGDIFIASTIEGSKYKAHQFVLVAFRKYFSAMMRGLWIESRTHSIRLEMPLNEYFASYLQYLYTGNLECIIDILGEVEPFIDYFSEEVVVDRYLLALCQQKKSRCNVC